LFPIKLISITSSVNYPTTTLKIFAELTGKERERKRKGEEKREGERERGREEDILPGQKA
jgi:hypothetical protein